MYVAFETMPITKSLIISSIEEYMFKQDGNFPIYNSNTLMFLDGCSNEIMNNFKDYNASHCVQWMDKQSLFVTISNIVSANSKFLDNDMDYLIITHNVFNIVINKITLLKGCKNCAYDHIKSCIYCTMCSRNTKTNDLYTEINECEEY